MSLCSTQSLNEMNSRIFNLESKGGWLLERKKFLRPFADNFEIWANENSVTFRGCPSICSDSSTITLLCPVNSF